MCYHQYIPVYPICSDNEDFIPGLMKDSLQQYI